MTPAIQAIQDALAQEFVDALAPLAPDWEHAAVNYEQGPEDPDNSLGAGTNYLAIYLTRPASGELTFVSLQTLPLAMSLLFQRLHQAMHHTGATWGSADLTLDAAEGSYEIRFDYGLPRRLNGIFDETSYDRFKPARYLADYAAGHDNQPFSAATP